MIKQKPNRKVTVRGKQRVNFFKLEKDIRRQHGLQNRINAKQAQLNTNQIITNEEILARCVACAKSAAKTKRVPPFLGLDIGQISPKECK